MNTSRKEFTLHRSVVNTAKGRWIINVDRVFTSIGDAVFLELTVLHDGAEKTEFRSLLANVSRHDLDIPSRCRSLSRGIGKWIETTEGDGYLNLLPLR